MTDISSPHTLTSRNQVKGILPRPAAYIGRDEEKKLLWQYSRLITAKPKCFALYFEGGGGVGKTRLLELYPQVLQEAAPPDQELFAQLRICRIVDFYRFESRSPSFIEQQLIEGLKQDDDPKPYHLPAADVERAFAPYLEEQERYRKEREVSNQQKNQQQISKLRQLFSTCWNSLSIQYPLVICFDTLETLATTIAAPSEALLNMDADLSGAGLVVNWIREVFPQLKHTLVLLSGRPVDDNRVEAELRRTGILAEDKRYLDVFTTPDAIREYLQSYNVEVPQDQLLFVEQITDGRPLLLTCYAETQRPAMGLPPGLPSLRSLETVASRVGFEDWLIDTILDPLPFASRPQLSRQATLIYCLHLLCFARRGLQRTDLQNLFDTLGLQCDTEVIAHLDQVALVKTIGDTFVLHDEIFVMIDQSKKAEELTLRPATLDYLCNISAERVRTIRDRKDLLPAMADHMYYELTRSFKQGYRIYTVYLDRLLRERSINAALVLSDTFWSLWNYRLVRDGIREYPYQINYTQEAMTDPDVITNQQIRYDEQVRKVKYLLASDRNAEARQQAQVLYKQFHNDGLLPGDQYLLADLSVTFARAIILDRATDQAERAKRVLETIIDLLNNEAQISDAFLRLRRMYFLGEVYAMLGMLYRRAQDFTEVCDVARRSRQYFRDYSEQEAPKLNDDVTNDLAQTSSNLAYSLALSGDMRLAQKICDENIKQYLVKASFYRQALGYNTYALVLLNSGQYAAAKSLIEKAEAAAQESGVRRAQGLVALSRARYERETRRTSDTVERSIESHLENAATLLSGEQESLRDVYFEWSSFARELAVHFKDVQPDLAIQYKRRALELLDQGMQALPERAHLQRADFLKSKATVYNLIQEYDHAEINLNEVVKVLREHKLPEFAQVICGKVALQRGIIHLYRDKDYQKALRLFAIGLARIYTFAPQHRDQQDFEQQIPRLVRAISETALRTFQQLLESGQLQIALDDAEQVYQPPDQAKWKTAWEESTKFMLYL